MNAPLMPTFQVRRRRILPRPIRQMVRHLPHVPSAAVVAAVLNLTLRRQLPPATLAALGDRVFFIEVRDADLVMGFRYRERRFIPVPPVGVPALRFRVNASDFAALALPPEAPAERFLADLVVVGDPAVADSVRATLAAIDVRHARKLLARVVRHVDRASRMS